jgi:hypothetical protein
MASLHNSNIAPKLSLNKVGKAIKVVIFAYCIMHKIRVLGRQCGRGSLLSVEVKICDIAGSHAH